MPITTRFDKRCRMCGWGNRQGAKFCGDCGEYFAPTVPGAAAAPPPRRRGSSWLDSPFALAGALGVVGIIGVLWAMTVLWPGKKEEPRTERKDFDVVHADPGHTRGQDRTTLPVTPPAPKDTKLYQKGPGGKYTPVRQAFDTVTASEVKEGRGNRRGMMLIPAGEFLMGSDEGVGQADERPRRKVRLKAYYIDKYEVTVSDYKRFAREAGGRIREQSAGSEDNHPVTQVEWEEASSYCRWRGKRLPTEAEWERAARAGSGDRWHFGDTSVKLGDYAWFKASSDGRTHPVGRKRPNDWWLYDMHGNVWEFVSDWYDEHYYARAPSRDPKGPSSSPKRKRVVRGGARNSKAKFCRSGYRNYPHPGDRGTLIGFRCAADAR